MARHLLISQLYLAPKPNLVKPLQNQEPKYPFTLSDAVLFSFALLSSLSTPIQYTIAEKTIPIEPLLLTLSTDEGPYELVFKFRLQNSCLSYMLASSYPTLFPPLLFSFA